MQTANSFLFRKYRISPITSHMKYNSEAEKAAAAASFCEYSDWIAFGDASGWALKSFNCLYTLISNVCVKSCWEPQWKINWFSLFGYGLNQANFLHSKTISLLRFIHRDYNSLFSSTPNGCIYGYDVKSIFKILFLKPKI